VQPPPPERRVLRNGETGGSIAAANKRYLLESYLWLDPTMSGGTAAQVEADNQAEQKAIAAAYALSRLQTWA